MPNFFMVSNVSARAHSARQLFALNRTARMRLFPMPDVTGLSELEAWVLRAQHAAAILSQLDDLELTALRTVRESYADFRRQSGARGVDDGTASGAPGGHALLVSLADVGPEGCSETRWTNLIHSWSLLARVHVETAAVQADAVIEALQRGECAGETRAPSSLSPQQSDCVSGAVCCAHTNAATWCAESDEARNLEALVRYAGTCGLLLRDDCDNHEHLEKTLRQRVAAWDIAWNSSDAALARLLLCDADAIPGYTDILSEELSCAAQCDGCPVVLAMLKDGRPDPTFNSSDCLRYAAVQGYAATMAALLKDRRANPAAEFSVCLTVAAQKGHVECVAALLADRRADPAAEFSACLTAAAGNGHVAIVEALLRDRRAQPGAKHSACLTAAAGNGHVAIVHALLRDRRADPTAKRSACLISAAAKGHVGVVSALLADRRANPAVLNSVCLEFAVKLGHVDVVAALLADRRANPAALDSYFLHLACQRGHAGVVSALLADRRADPTREDSRCLREAAKFGHTSVLRALLDDGRASPAADHSLCLWIATKHERDDIVAMLLADRRADPAANDNACLKHAADNGHVNIVRAFLSDGRADPSALPYTNFYVFNSSVRELLHSDPRMLRRTQVFQCFEKLLAVVLLVCFLAVFAAHYELVILLRRSTRIPNA